MTAVGVAEKAGGTSSVGEIPEAPVDRFFRNVASIPSVPSVAAQLVSLLDDESVGIPELAALIARDQSLTARVLKLANSARYSGEHTLVSVEQAASRIGLRNVRDLTLACVFATAFPRVPGFDWEDFWFRAVLGADISRKVAQCVGADGDEWYLVGLLLRVGELVMRMVDPESLRPIDLVAPKWTDRLDLEREVLGCSQIDVSAKLLWRWGFPARISADIAIVEQALSQASVNRAACTMAVAAIMAQSVDYKTGFFGGAREHLLSTPWLLDGARMDVDQALDIAEAVVGQGDLGSIWL